MVESPVLTIHQGGWMADGEERSEMKIAQGRRLCGYFRSNARDRRLNDMFRMS
jgi:hypothetical protein